MPGLLDMLQTASQDPATSQGILRFGLSLLQSKGNLGGAIGQAGMQGLQGAQDYRQQQFQRQIQQSQLDQIKRQKEMQNLPGQFVTPAQKLPTQDNADVGQPGEPPVTPAGFDFSGYVNALMGKDPMQAVQLRQLMQKPITKYGTKPEYDQNGRAYVTDEAGNLKYLDGGQGPVMARDKQEFVNGVAVNPYQTKPGTILPQDPNKAFSLGPDGKPVANTGFQQFELGKATAPALVGAATSRANNAANIQKDYTIAGVGPNGEPSQNVEAMAQAIAKGQTAPISGFALARPQGQAVMARVMQINPEYDATTYGAKVKASKDFGSGQQGNAMRSFAVAGQHLDQLGQLVDALNNGNYQIVNKLGNAYATQTGSTAPTNFDAAKDVVSKEVVKAIVAGGGGVAEREELSKLMSNAKSPAQLKGVIAQYRGLMAAQHDALLQQRRAAGLPDSTLPSYTDANGSPGSNDVRSQADAILRGGR